MNFQRKIVADLRQRALETPRFMQIIIGPRQVGKTTSVRQLAESLDFPTIYSAADSSGTADPLWIRSKWLEARALLQESKQALLILDEVQLISEWQRTVKGLWDEDRANKLQLNVIITGSSALLLKQGSESLAGRFEKHELLQWSFAEMHEAFGYSLEDFILQGGYPGAAPIRADEQRWKEYINASLIETVLTKDIISLNRIDKPALLKQLFAIVCAYPAEIVSYNNFLGQLADAGNVTTLSNYRLLLEDAYLLKVIDKWSGSTARSRASKPKWILRDNALITALSAYSLQSIKQGPQYGRLVENAVISHLLKILPQGYYWREKNNEVDYVVQIEGKTYALEIKAGNKVRSKSGLQAFLKQHPKAMPLIIGADGIALEDLLSATTWKW